MRMQGNPEDIILCRDAVGVAAIGKLSRCMIRQAIGADDAEFSFNTDAHLICHGRTGWSRGGEQNRRILVMPRVGDESCRETESERKSDYGFHCAKLPDRTLRIHECGNFRCVMEAAVCVCCFGFLSSSQFVET